MRFHFCVQSINQPLNDFIISKHSLISGFQYSVLAPLSSLEDNVFKFIKDFNENYINQINSEDDNEEDFSEMEDNDNSETDNEQLVDLNESESISED